MFIGPGPVLVVSTFNLVAGTAKSKQVQIM